METMFLITGAIVAVWFVVLMRRPRARKPDPDGFEADPALTKALEESDRDFLIFRRHP